MSMPIKYVHTNLIARDWRKLSEFYIQVFGCMPVFPERNMKGNWLDRGTGIENVHIQGIHLRLPGHGPTGPTLEIFQYNHQLKDTVFLSIDDATWGGDKKHAGKLRSMVTSEYRQTQPKFVDAFQIKNFLYIGISSNLDWMVPSGL